MDDKSLYNRLLGGGILCPENICYASNGFYLNANSELISRDNLMDIVFSKSEVFIKKSVTSEGGHGVYYFNTQNSTRDNLSAIIDEIGRDFVVQEALTQSPTIAQINPSSINTIRVLTLLRKDGTVKNYSTVLRMGRSGSKVDNASSGGITCGVNPDGSLKGVAYTADGDKFTEHPDTKIKFSDIVIPNYAQIIEAVKRLHPLLPMFRLLSWDIALNKDNELVLIEVNMKYGQLDFHQLNNGPIFGDDTKEILEEVFHNSKDQRATKLQLTV
jgi:hypothetical protein